MQNAIKHLAEPDDEDEGNKKKGSKKKTARKNPSL
jgi:hypothetical protein